MELRIGQGYDIHTFNGDNPFILGGIEIPHSKKIRSHSDGDVLIHALIDSLFGAIAIGDIGTHFPDNDLQFKGISSKTLLQKAYSMIKDKGYSIINTDMTILLETPKLRPYIQEIQISLATLLHITPERVSIKAKTREGCDTTGRGEAVEAMVITLLVKEDMYG